MDIERLAAVSELTVRSKTAVTPLRELPDDSVGKALSVGTVITETRACLQISTTRRRTW